MDKTENYEECGEENKDRIGHQNTVMKTLYSWKDKENRDGKHDADDTNNTKNNVNLSDGFVVAGEQLKHSKTHFQIAE